MSQCQSCHRQSSSLSSCSLCTTSQCCRTCLTLLSLKSQAQPVPACANCCSRATALRSLVADEGLQWAQLSRKGRTWLATSPVRTWSRQCDASLVTYLGFAVSAEDLDYIEKDVELGRSNPNVFTWDLAELLALLVNPAQVTSGEYAQTVTRVLRAYCGRNSATGYCQGLNMVVVWLLIFMDEDSAFWTLCFLVEQWMLPDFYCGNKGGNALNGFFIEADVIAQLLKSLCPDFPELVLSVEEVARMIALPLLVPTFVNEVDVFSTIFLWDRLAKEGSSALLKGVVAVLLAHVNELQEGMHPLDLLSQLPKVSSNLADFYRTVRVSTGQIDLLREQARNRRAQEWHSDLKLALSIADSCSHFSTEEVKLLHQQFSEFTAQKQAIGQNGLGVTREEFVHIIEETSPNMSAEASALFDLFDEDGSGFLDFREFVICVSSMSKGSLDDKLRLCFDAFDVDHSGYLQREEFDQLAKALLTPYTSQLKSHFNLELEQRVNGLREALSRLRRQQGSVLSFERFQLGVRTSPQLSACFQEHTRTSLTYKQVFWSQSPNLFCGDCTLI